MVSDTRTVIGSETTKHRTVAVARSSASAQPLACSASETRFRHTAWSPVFGAGHSAAGAGKPTRPGTDQVLGQLPGTRRVA